MFIYTHFIRLIGDNGLNIAFEYFRFWSIHTFPFRNSMNYMHNFTGILKIYQPNPHLLVLIMCEQPRGKDTPRYRDLIFYNQYLRR